MKEVVYEEVKILCYLRMFIMVGNNVVLIVIFCLK